MRNLDELYPDYTAEIDAIRGKGLTVELLQKIIRKHKANANYNRKLYERYVGIEEGIPIFSRQPRFDEENPINNKINNDFFGEIVDFKTGYFAGKPIAYGYSSGEESEETTGGKEAIDEATKAVTDFTTRNNMYGCDMEITKLASICGYAGRLFYIDEEKNERVMPVMPFETIILTETKISEPAYAVRYFKTKDIDSNTIWIVEFYDDTNVYTFSGQLGNLTPGEVRPHLFDYCPLQGISNNYEMTGDCEKVLSAIDDYDKVLSDNSNEIEAFVHAYMVFDNVGIDDKELLKAQKAGSLNIRSRGTQEGKVYFLTKDINDSFTEHHLKRLEDNIYRFSKTPNLNDETFGNAASGQSLKYKLLGHETKCGMFQANMMDAAQHMWKVLASSWGKKSVKVDPLQCTMDFKRNFPLDIEAEARAAQTLRALGYPLEEVFKTLSWVDDADYIMEKVRQEKEESTSYYEDAENELLNAPTAE